MPSDPVKVQCDSTSLKSFVSYIVKRHDGATRRAPGHRLLTFKFVVAEVEGWATNESSNMSW